MTHPFLVAITFAINTSLVPEVACVLYNFYERVFFCMLVRMPVYCIAYGCDIDQCNASQIASFHHLPSLKKPLLLIQVRIATELC